MGQMKKKLLVAFVLGTAGVGLLVAGAAVTFGTGPALLAAGAALLAAAVAI